MKDIHAHILPGVDDGARNWSVSEELLSMAWQQGIQSIIATPHFTPQMSPEKLQTLLEELRERARVISPDFQLSLGQEILYFEELPRYLTEGRALTLAKSRYVLIEFRPGDGYGRLCKAVRDLVQAGFFPVIAHVERYFCLREAGRLPQLAGMGALLQMNAGSLIGGGLDRQASWCRRQAAAGNIHFVATDMHDPARRPPRLAEARKAFSRVWWRERAAGLGQAGGRRGRSGLSRGAPLSREELCSRLFGGNQSFILEDLAPDAWLSSDTDRM